LKTPVYSSIEHQVEERELSDYWLANNDNNKMMTDKASNFFVVTYQNTFQLSSSSFTGGHFIEVKK